MNKKGFRIDEYAIDPWAICMVLLIIIICFGSYIYIRTDVELIKRDCNSPICRNLSCSSFVPEKCSKCDIDLGTLWSPPLWLPFVTIIILCTIVVFIVYMVERNETKKLHKKKDK